MNEDIIELDVLYQNNKDVIRIYQHKPFHCMFISSNQATALLASRASRVHVGVSGYPLISDIAKKRVLLYSMVTPSGLPIVDLITTTGQRSENLCTCLVAAADPIINRDDSFEFTFIVVDWNFGLIAGACHGLARCPLSQFIQWFYMNMVDDFKEKIPLVQVCRAQLMAAMRRRLADESADVIDAAMRLFFRMSECASLQEGEEWFKHVVLLFKSKHVTSQVEASLTAARTCCDPVASATNSNKPENEADPTWDEAVRESPFGEHFAQIRVAHERTLDDCDVSKPPNALYSPDVLTHFDHFLPVYPVWCRYVAAANVPLVNTPLERRFAYVTTELFAGRRHLGPSLVVQTLMADNEKLIVASNLCSSRASAVSLKSQKRHPNAGGAKRLQRGAQRIDKSVHRK